MYDQLTDKETRQAVTDVLTQLGEIVLAAPGTKNNPSPVVGVVTVTFHRDGNYDLCFAGQLMKGLTLGALEDLKLHFYTTVEAISYQNRVDAMVEASQIPDKDKN